MEQNKAYLLGCDEIVVRSGERNMSEAVVRVTLEALKYDYLFYAGTELLRPWSVRDFSRSVTCISLFDALQPVLAGGNWTEHDSSVAVRPVFEVLSYAFIVRSSKLKELRFMNEGKSLMCAGRISCGLFVGFTSLFAAGKETYAYSHTEFQSDHGILSWNNAGSCGPHYSTFVRHFEPDQVNQAPKLDELPLLSRVKGAVIVVAPPSAEKYWLHQNASFHGGPWPVMRAFCSDTSLEKVINLMCAHYQAYSFLQQHGLEYALVVEDDAQIVPNFWEQLELRFRVLNGTFGILWLEHLIHRNYVSGSGFVTIDGVPVAREFDPLSYEYLGHGDSHQGAYCAAGYLLSRKGANVVLSFPFEKLSGLERATSEQLTTLSAEKVGGFFSLPPLVWQCNRKGSRIQDSQHEVDDKRRRMTMKKDWNTILEGRKSPPFPSWLVEDCGIIGEQKVSDGWALNRSIVFEKRTKSGFLSRVVGCVFVIAPLGYGDASWDKLRVALAKGPWPVVRVWCDHPKMSSPEKNLLCAHHNATQQAKGMRLDYAMILEDDAQLVPSFWHLLEERLLSVSDFGIFWIEHLVQQNYMTGKGYVAINDQPVAFKFNSEYGFNHWHYGDPVHGVYCTAGYVLSERGVLAALRNPLESYAELEFPTSEQITTFVAEKAGGFFSVPPLVWQCNKEISRIQTSLSGIFDRVRRLKKKRDWNVLLGRLRRPLIPKWMVESCAVRNEDSLVERVLQKR